MTINTNLPPLYGADEYKISIRSIDGHVQLVQSHGGPVEINSDWFAGKDLEIIVHEYCQGEFVRELPVQYDWACKRCPAREIIPDIKNRLQRIEEARKRERK